MRKTNLNDEDLSNAIEEALNGKSSTDTKKDADDSKSNKSKKRKKQKKIKSYIGRVLDNKKNRPVALTVLAFPFAFILDILRIIKNFIICLVVALIILGVIGAAIVWTEVKPTVVEYKDFADKVVDESSYSDFKLTESSYIYDTDGNTLAKLKASMDSEYLSYDDIPSEVVDAFIAVEDRTFWENPGIDLKGIIRVGTRYLKTKGVEEHGASTITQQLARNIYLTHEVSIERKGKEMLIAMGLTKKYTKKEIMEFYCNDICFANAYYGIQAAAKGYFNKDAKDLTLSQIAYLCSIPNSPEYYDPYKNPDRALKRRDKILNDMKELGYITDDECEAAKAEAITIEKPTYTFNDYMTTYATDCAVRYLMKHDGFEFKYKFKDNNEYTEYNTKYSQSYSDEKNKLYTGGYKIYTSLNPTVQQSLQDTLNNQLAFDGEVNEATGIYALQGAITAYDNNTGKVIAVVGGRSQDSDSQTYSLNRAYQSFRQPGSTIKPLVVYTPALMNGFTPDTTVFNIDVTEAKKPGVNAQTLSGKAMTLRKALEHSKNGVAWQVFDKLGPENALKFLNDMEFSKICPDDYNDAAALGGLTYGTNTVEMAAAYATIENHGEYREATCLVSMLDRDGKEIYNAEEAKPVYEAKAADTMVDMMKGVLTKGTAVKLGWYKDTEMVAACKTGTTNNSKDGWLCGFTPYYTVAVWVGYDTPKELDNLYGATYPGQIWKESMLKLIEGKEIKNDFEKDDYSGEDDESYDDFEMSDDLPEYAYDTYMKGRSDDEVLSSGYTVHDYRKDRVTGETVQNLISDMYNISDSERLQELYDTGRNIIDTIYSRKYKDEMQKKLDAAFNSQK